MVLYVILDIIIIKIDYYYRYMRRRTECVNHFLGQVMMIKYKIETPPARLKKIKKKKIPATRLHRPR